MRKEIEDEFRKLMEELVRGWQANDIARFMRTNQQIGVVFSRKLQEIVNRNEPVHTIDLETKDAEGKLIKLNTLLDEVIKKKGELSEITLRIDGKQVEKDESLNHL